MTPKQKLWAHIETGHPSHSHPNRVVSLRMTLEKLAKWHATEHHRFHTNHIHEGVNLGAGDRPPGWRTGEGAIAK